jgi:hypothetical protein
MIRAMLQSGSWQRWAQSLVGVAILDTLNSW